MSEFRQQKAQWVETLLRLTLPAIIREEIVAAYISIT